MPETTLLAFRDHARECPLVEWLEGLEKLEPKAYVKCLERIEQLERMGHELRRPAAPLGVAAKRRHRASSKPACYNLPDRQQWVVKRFNYLRISNVRQTV